MDPAFNIELLYIMPRADNDVQIALRTGDNYNIECQWTNIMLPSYHRYLADSNSVNMLCRDILPYMGLNGKTLLNNKT